MRKITRVCVCLVSVLLLMAAGLCSGCSSDMYSEEQHIQRIKERAEKRFLGEESKYTGLEVYPIYNEYDTLKYALIEFEPQGFLYVSISNQAYPWKGMYTLSSREPESWMPYRVKEGAREDIYDADGICFIRPPTVNISVTITNWCLSITKAISRWQESRMGAVIFWTEEKA